LVVSCVRFAPLAAQMSPARVKRMVPLNVGGAFHTPLMRPASDALVGELAGVEFRAGGPPVGVEPRRAPPR